MDFHHHHQAMNELDQLRDENQAMKRRLDKWEQMLPAAWYAQHTFIEPGRLRKARMYLHHDRQGGRWRYRARSVLEKWPHLWADPATGKPPVLPEL